MTQPHARTLTAGTGPLAGRPSLLIRVVDLVLDWSDRARDRHQLGGLTDSELKDIGLSRADVTMETSKPFWRF